MSKRTITAIVAAFLVVAGVGLLSTFLGDVANDATSAPVSPTFSAVESLPGQSDPSGEDETNEAETPQKPKKVAKAEPRIEPDPPKPVTTPRKTTRQVARAPKYDPAVLQIVTNFDKADVTVNGVAYPEYFEPGQEEGMILPAGGPHHVQVKFDGKIKEYFLSLRPHETRMLLVELSGWGATAPVPRAAPAAAQKKPKQQQKKDDKKDEKSPGKITVYSKPAGTVIVDGNPTGEKTPGTVELENGRHEVQVQYETGSTSEKKIVRVRTGSRIKLFFRERNTRE